MARGGGRGRGQAPRLERMPGLGPPGPSGSLVAAQQGLIKMVDLWELAVRHWAANEQ